MSRALLAPLLLVAAAVQAQDMTAFGLQLGAPFSLPACPNAAGIYSWPASGACFRHVLTAQPDAQLRDGVVLIRFAIRETPEIIVGNEVAGRIVDGRLEGITATTRGAQSESLVAAALVHKYGEPQTSTTREAINGFGAKATVTDLGWKGPPEVTYLPVTTSLSVGTLYIETTVGREARDRAIKAISDTKRKL